MIIETESTIKRLLQCSKKRKILRFCESVFISLVWVCPPPPPPPPLGLVDSLEREMVKSVQSTLSHLIPLFRVPRLHAFTWSMDYFNTIYIEQTDLGVGLHNLMNNLKPLTFRVKTFQLLLSMKFQLNVNS